MHPASLANHGALLRQATKKQVMINRLNGKSPEKLAKKAMKEAVKERRKYLRFRSPFMYRLRMMLAWSINMMAFVVCSGLSVIYGRIFGLQRTNDMLLGWATGAPQRFEPGRGLARGIFEPHYHPPANLHVEGPS